MTLIYIFGCGPTDVSVDVEELNVDTELNTTITMSEPDQSISSQGDLQVPVSIPTPAGLQAMTEVLESVAGVSDGLQETAKSFGEIFSSLNTPTPISQIKVEGSEKIINLNNLLLIGFIVTSETTSKWNHTGLKNSYIGWVNLNGMDRTIEILIFDTIIKDPSFAAQITADILMENGYGHSINFYQNLSLSCESQVTCEDLLDLLRKQNYFLFHFLKLVHLNLL